MTAKGLMREQTQDQAMLRLLEMQEKALSNSKTEETPLLRRIERLRNVDRIRLPRVHPIRERELSPR